MTCASCGKNKKGNGYIQPKALDNPPFGATDMMVYDNNEVRRFQAGDWNDDRHKLILFFPETFTPVCQTEMGNLNDWVEAFNELGVDVFGATTDPIHSVKDWYESEEDLKDPNYKVLSTYILPARMGITNGGRAKRASVFVTKEGDMVIQEHFLKVGRSLKELHRMMYAYTTDSYCAEGWEDPSNGFLTNDNEA
jgi:alkyl hydroperoxide reductase subunit AhpC